MQKLVDQNGLFKTVRGKGLLNAVVIDDSPESETAWNFFMSLAENGLLAKPTHGNIIRFAPPLIMTEAQMLECIGIITYTYNHFKK
jgi:ornithine--oxo-acid transaminase